MASKEIISHLTFLGEREAATEIGAPIISELGNFFRRQIFRNLEIIFGAAHKLRGYPGGKKGGSRPTVNASTFDRSVDSLKVGLKSHKRGPHSS